MSKSRIEGAQGPNESGGVTDIPQLMSEIRSRVRAELAAHPEASRPFKSYIAAQNKSGHRRAGELLHSEELHYLNTHWREAQDPQLERVTSHRGGFLARCIVGIKRRILSVVWELLLKDHIQSSNDFQMRLVQFLNSVSTYVDDRDRDSFWELVRKIDYDVSKALNRIELIADEQSGNLRTVERSITDSINVTLRELNDRITQLQTLAEGNSGRLHTVEAVSTGVERIVGRLTRELPASSTESKIVLPSSVPDQSYVMLENRYRGSEEEIAERLQIYPPLFPKDKGPVLEIGAGRGELQILFREAHVPSYGIDLDPAMVSAARERGAFVDLADVSVLENVQDRSLGGVIAIQVVEHLTRQQLASLFNACARKVAVGGKIVFETINPQSVLALSSNYFRDPTHIWPLHPDTLSFAMTMAGLKVIEIRKLSPVPDGSLLKRVPVEEYMTPRWAHAVDTLNRNVDQLNDLLFGYQDYAIVAESV